MFSKPVTFPMTNNTKQNEAELVRDLVTCYIFPLDGF